MAKFTDTKGRPWSLEITVGTVRRVRKDLDVDLLKLSEDGFRPLARLMNDFEKLVDLLHYLCREQAEAAGVDALAFADGLGGEEFFNAQKALLDAVADFFPDPKQRESFRLVLRKGKEVDDAIADKQMREIEAIDPQAEAEKASRTPESEPGSSSTSSPGSSGSPTATPTP